MKGVFQTYVSDFKFNLYAVRDSIMQLAFKMSYLRKLQPEIFSQMTLLKRKTKFWKYVESSC